MEEGSLNDGTERHGDGNRVALRDGLGRAVVVGADELQQPAQELRLEEGEQILTGLEHRRDEKGQAVCVRQSSQWRADAQAPARASQTEGLFFLT